MIKILGICGSPRKAASEFVLTKTLEHIKSIDTDLDVELLTLRNKKIATCIQCDKCIHAQSDKCVVYQDDMQELYDAFYRADAYLIASPVYAMSISAPLSLFFSRFRPSYSLMKNNPDYFLGKAGAAIAVGGTRNGGQELTVNTILGFYHSKGILPVNGALGLYAGACVWSKDQREMEQVDELGLQNCLRIGEKLVKVSKMLQRGKWSM